MTEIKKPELDDETLEHVGRVIHNAYRIELAHIGTRTGAALAVLEALHPHYVAANQNDDWKMATSAEDIRKGDTVERTRTLSDDGTVVIIAGTACNLGMDGNWRSEDGHQLTKFGMTNSTHRVRRAPRPELPTEPGSVIIATEVRGETGEWRAFLEPDGDWYSPVPINGHTYHSPEHITAFTPARVVPEGELIDLGDVRAGDRVRMVLNSGDEATFTVTRVGSTYLCSELNNFPANTIRTVHLLHREEA